MQGQPETRKENHTIIIVGVFVLVAIIMVMTFMSSGQTGVMTLIHKMMKYIIIAVVIGLIAWVVMKIFKKPKIDLVENDRRDIIEAAIQSKPPLVRDLYVSGDKEHSEFRLGRIIGYCQLMSYKDLDLLAGLTDAQIKQMEAEGKIPAEYIIKEDVFVYKRFPFPFSMFEEPKVLRTLEDEHSQILGDVKVYAVSLIRKFGYFYPNRSHLDIARIDIGVIREAWRGQIHQFLKDMVAINQRAVGLDSEHKKELDQRKLLKIPSPLGEEASRRGE